MVAGRIPERRNLGPAVDAYKSSVVFSEALIFHFLFSFSKIYRAGILFHSSSAAFSPITAARIDKYAFLNVFANEYYGYKSIIYLVYVELIKPTLQVRKNIA